MSTASGSTVNPRNFDLTSINNPELYIEELSEEDFEGLELGYERQEVGAVNFSVIEERMEGIATEMTEAILRTSRNPILYAAKDFTCTIMDPQARLLTMHDCLPIHVGTLVPPLRYIIRSFKGDIQEGDVFVNNASYAGNAHVGDWTMFVPVFHEGKLVCWSANKCHLIDTGAHVPANVDPAAEDVYQEALHFPAVRLARNYEIKKDLTRFIGYNFRYTEQWYGDFLAQLGSLWIGEERMQGLCEEYGYDRIRSWMEETLDYGDQKMRAEISNLPQESVEVEIKGESFEVTDGEPLHLKLRLTVEDDQIIFDYRDMPDQLPFSYNLSYATTIGSAYEGSFPFLGDVPLNQGALQHITVLSREGSVAGIPEYPVGTSAATVSLCDEIANLVFMAWSRLVPDRAMAGMAEYSAANSLTAGVDPETGEPYSHVHYLSAGGAGATRGYDGLPHMFGHCIMGNMGYESIEIHELATPQIVEEISARTDSGGEGRWRGAVGVSQKIRPVNHTMELIFNGTGHNYPPQGEQGGNAGTTSDHWIEDAESGEIVEQLPNGGSAVCEKHQRWTAHTAGGGGVGDPLERDPDLVRRDVLNGFVSEEAAYDIYGVALDAEPEKFRVLEDETQDRRRQLRETRSKESQS